MSDRSVDGALAEANLLMQADRREGAKAILKVLVEQNPPSEALYEDVIYNYLLGGAYREAKELARRYEREFGAEPSPELSLESIEKEERKQQDALARHDTGEPRSFRRLSLWERGNFPRYLPWSGTVWQEVRIEPDAILLKKRLRTHRLKWAEIERAALTKKRSFYGENTSYILRLVVLETAYDKKYRVDVSVVAPEFNNVEALERAVREHLALEEEQVQERSAVSDWFGGFLTLLVIIFATLLLLYLSYELS